MLFRSKNFTLEGCGTSEIDGTGVGDNCPDPLVIGIEMIPDVDPLVLHDIVEYDLCQGGVVKAGPAHAAGPGTGAVPCTGTVLGAQPGVAGKLTAGVWNWDLKKGAAEGVYYVDGGDIQIATDPKDGQLELTVIAATVDNDRECANAKSSGNIQVGAGADITSHATASEITLVAAGDVQFLGSATVEGAILAHEQIDFRGGTGGGGAVIAESYCDHPGSPVNGASEIGRAHV